MICNCFKILNSFFIYVFILKASSRYKFVFWGGGGFGGDLSLCSYPALHLDLMSVHKSSVGTILMIAYLGKVLISY